MVLSEWLADVLRASLENGLSNTGMKVTLAGNQKNSIEVCLSAKLAIQFAVSKLKNSDVIKILFVTECY